MQTAEHRRLIGQCATDLTWPRFNRRGKANLAGLRSAEIRYVAANHGGEVQFFSFLIVSAQRFGVLADLPVFLIFVSLLTSLSPPGISFYANQLGLYIDRKVKPCRAMRPFTSHWLDCRAFSSGARPAPRQTFPTKPAISPLKMTSSEDGRSALLHVITPKAKIAVCNTSGSSVNSNIHSIQGVSPSVSSGSI